MRQLILFFVFGVLCLGNLFSAKPIIPPGTVKINDSLFVDRTEICNVDYREFLYWTKQKFGVESIEYTSIIPDSSVWSDATAYTEPYAQLYFRHPAYSNYPLVGVTYEQALKYCEWRTDRVNEMLFVRINKLNIDTLKTAIEIPVYVKYRLPTKSEWESIAALPFSKKTIKKFSKKKMQGIIRYNLIYGKGDADVLSDMSDITATVESYWPNELGVYNIIGNVAEMTSQKGLAKGGSWKHTQEEVAIDVDFEYDSPQNWLGFRCVCDVLVKL
ncbi:MAG: SUMF1/EgtB/PvdO family nonheme iron enzyme [Bacteroidales bacterium]|nr:SUMF1/EgtB/PvdO family nonheme iron enzyme [Bacteroidales bacterium]